MTLVLSTQELKMWHNHVFDINVYGWKRNNNVLLPNTPAQTRLSVPLHDFYIWIAFVSVIFVSFLPLLFSFLKASHSVVNHCYVHVKRVNTVNWTKNQKHQPHDGAIRNITWVIKTHPELTVDVWTALKGNSSSGCWDISVWTGAEQLIKILSKLQYACNIQVAGIKKWNIPLQKNHFGSKETPRPLIIN